MILVAKVLMLMRMVMVMVMAVMVVVMISFLMLASYDTVSDDAVFDDYVSV